MDPRVGPDGVIMTAAPILQSCTLPVTNPTELAVRCHRSFITVITFVRRMTSMRSNSRGTCVTGVPFIVSQAPEVLSHRKSAYAGTSPDSCRAQRLMEKAPCMIAFGVKLNNFKTVGIEFGIRDGILVHA